MNSREYCRITEGQIQPNLGAKSYGLNYDIIKAMKHDVKVDVSIRILQKKPHNKHDEFN